MPENKQVAPNPVVEINTGANTGQVIDQVSVRTQWLDDAIANIGKVENTLTPIEKLDRRKRQRRILAHLYRNPNSLEVITEFAARFPAEILLGEDFAGRFKGVVFEELALASIEPRNSAYLETEKFLLGILQQPLLLTPLFEGIIPSTILRRLSPKSHKYLDAHNIATASENDINLFIEEIHNTVLSDPNLRASERATVLAYLNYIEIVRKYFLGKKRETNNDGIAFEIVEDPASGKSRIRITGLIEAKGYSSFPRERIDAIMSQRENASKKIYELITAMQPFLEFFLEQLGLIEIIPSTIECLKPDELSYTLLIGEGTWYTGNLQRRLDNAGNSKLIKIPFTHQEIWHLANFLVSSYQKK